MLIPLVALFAGQTVPPFVPNAKLGVPYLLGYVSRVSGSNQVLDVGSQRWVTINSVRTALFFGAKDETHVAGEGQKLVLLKCTIKNPSNTIAQLHTSDTFQTRIFDTGAVAGDYHYIGAVDSTLAYLRKDLKKGESADFTVILRGPARFSTLRIGAYYQYQGRSNIRRYDLTASVAKSTSVFSNDGLVYADTAKVKVDQPFELDALEAKVLGLRALPGENKVAVDVQVTNRTLLPAKWGWQYVSSHLTTSTGESVAYYPDFIDKATGKSWDGDIPAGASVTGEYHFSPGKPITATSCVLKTSSAKRTLTVSF